MPRPVFEKVEKLFHFLRRPPGDTVLANSRHVAEVFGRLHKDVLRAVDNLDCSDELNGRNFALVEYLDAKGETRRAYDMTKDGFTFLVMGFTGSTAARFKEGSECALRRWSAKPSEAPFRALVEAGC